MDWKKIGMAAIAAGALVGAGFVGAAMKAPEVIVSEKVVEKLVPYKVVETVEKEVPVEVIVTETVEDEAFLAKVCDRMMYDDIMECKEEVSAEDAALKMALELLDDEQEVFDLLEDEGLVVDEDEVKVIKVYDDFEDIEIVDSDFDDGEYTFKVKAKFEDKEKDEKFSAIFTLEVEDGEAEIKSVELA